MESPNYAPAVHVDASRPSLGFPVGTALLLIIIFTLSGIFSCCYHWDRLRSLRRRAAYADPENPKPHSDIKDMKANEKQSVPVLMPGDKVPTFIALPCPCEPRRDHNADAVFVGGGGASGEAVKPPPIKPTRLLAMPLN